MTVNLFGIVKCAWAVGAVVLLLWTLYVFDGKPNSDAEVVLAYGMLALAFPASILLLIVGGTLGYVGSVATGSTVETSRAWMIVEWGLFFAVGYWQWFRLLPWLARKTTTRKTGVRGP